LNTAPHEPFAHLKPSGPHPVPEPSRPAQVALLLAGALALALLVVQVIAGSHGVISGQDAPFHAWAKPAIRLPLG
jgi:hypothetical protein